MSNREGAAGPSATERASWQAAQRYELEYWARRGTGELANLSPRFAAAAEALTRQLDDNASTDWRRCAMQVGTAGLAEIHSLPARRRVAVEPLAGALQRRGLLVREGVAFVTAMGEKLPFGDGEFSVALAPNVIDHVAAPAQLVAELHRCIEPRGLLWLSCNVSPAWAIAPSRLLHLARVGYFAGHPWSFTALSLRRLVEHAGFRVRAESFGPSVDVEAPLRMGLRERVKDRLLRVQYLLLERP